MKNRNIQNEELDRIGRKLLRTAKVQSEEIERIVSSPMLFDTVKARIKTEQFERNSKNISGFRANLQIWNWQRASAMVLLLFIFCAIGLIVFSKFSRPQQIERAVAPEIKSKVEQIEIQPSATPQIAEDSPAIVSIKNPVIESPKIAKQKVFVNKIPKPRKSAMQPLYRQRRLQPKENESGGEFYALASSGNPNETGEELKIVRTELSRSSLFALGVNLPIENESEKIKTDLLVGADGVARAIRLVSKTENQ